MSLFSKNSFGLDISDTSLKLVWLDEQGYIKSWNELAIPAGIMEKGIIKNKDKAAEAIKKIISTAKGRRLGTKKVVACLPETKTFIKVIEVPATMEEKRIGEFILEGIGHHFPLKAEEVYLDWQPVSGFGEEDLIQAMVGVAPRKIVDDYLDVITNAGLQPEAMQIEAGAIVNALVPEKKTKEKKDEKPFMILDLGANRTSIILYSGGAIEFSISIPVSGAGITKEIADVLNIPAEEAEKRKMENGLGNAKTKEYKIIEKNFAIIVKELKQAMKFENRRDREEVKKIILCGGVAQTKKLPEYLADKTRLEVVMGDPFANIKAERRQHIKLPGAPLSYATAIGLALAGIESG